MQRNSACHLLPTKQERKILLSQPSTKQPARKTIKEYYANTPKLDERNYSAAIATNYSKRRCTICVDANRPERVYRSHDTSNHRVLAPLTNKGDKEYYHLFAETELDTGANDHFFCDNPHRTTVVTAAQFAPQTGGKRQ